MSTLSCWYLLHAARKGRFPGALVHLWHERHGYNPLAQERRVAYVQTVRLLMLVAMVCTVVFFVLDTPTRLLDEDTRYKFSWGIVTLWLLACALGAYVIFCLPSARRRISEPLTLFLSWSGKSLSEISNFSVEQLRTCADNILLSGAADYVACKSIDTARYAPDQYANLADLLDRCKRFEKRYEVCSVLGLVGDSKSYFVEEAARRRPLPVA